MRIDRVRLVHVPLQLVAPLRTSAGDHTSRTAVLVEITADDGTVGWGENVAPEGAFYTGETSAASLAYLREVLVPGLVNEGDDDYLDDDDDMFMPMADHAVSSALADVETRQRGVPLAAAVGRRDVTRVHVGAVVGMHSSIDQVVEEAMQRVAEGYSRVKVKIAPGRDVDVVAAVRNAMPQSVDLHVDANGAYGRDDLSHLAFLDRFGVGLVEQPFPAGDLELHGRLSRSISTPVGLDESVSGLVDAMDAIASAACSVINVKPARVGGFHQATGILRLCAENGIDAWVGGMLESGIGRAGCVALATHPACTMTADLSASSRYFVSDVTEPFGLVDGYLEVPRGPGLGVEPLPEVLARPSTVIETVFER
jgi:O-succinylbenzoate synthase